MFFCQSFVIFQYRFCTYKQKPDTVKHRVFIVLLFFVFPPEPKQPTGIHDKCGSCQLADNLIYGEIYRVVVLYRIQFDDSTEADLSCVQFSVRNHIYADNSQAFELDQVR